VGLKEKRTLQVLSWACAPNASKNEGQRALKGQTDVSQLIGKLNVIHLIDAIKRR
jgi:hypothetical protein